MKSGCLNLLEPPGPVQACNGIDLPLTKNYIRLGSFLSILLLMKPEMSFAMGGLTLRRLKSYIHEAPILDVSRLHTTTQHSR